MKLAKPLEPLWSVWQGSDVRATPWFAVVPLDTSLYGEAMLRFQLTAGNWEPPDGVNWSCTVTSFALVPYDGLVIPTGLVFVFVVVDEPFSSCSFECPLVTVH